MLHVLISPSYGKPEARQHWHDTLDQEVQFDTPSHRGLLSGEQFDALIGVHPEGRARFWGAKPSHDKKMALVAPGDVVLFTGKKHVLAIGEVGVIFRNADFAARLWPPKGSAPGWHTVYSLVAFERTDITYAELNEIIGYKNNHDFPGQILLTDDRAQAVCEAFLLTPRQRPARVTDTLSDRSVRIAAAEEVRTAHTTYERPGATQLVRRREGALVREYRRASGLTHGTRYYCPAGITDLYVESPVVELIEAKGGTTRGHVRQALAQLLDYAPHCPKPAARLTALFPAPLEFAETTLLHRYGIDCVHRVAEGHFERLPAPDETRKRMVELVRRDA
ncbi:hypothetical protein QWM81_08185 [Streptomyces ficellus]|uniref:EVE domain-containing protein n=1 Tax=Streptomyces ficellus TaxID=1977088 RepID=A0ABT7Z3H8_9ACTN|nr:hypothetical protein [Streptomyces ficellus]MDN3294025.1 hypothetical protein [Streptomyces ficellus]